MTERFCKRLLFKCRHEVSDAWSHGRMTSQWEDTALNIKGGTGLVRRADVEISFAPVEFCKQPEPQV